MSDRDQNKCHIKIYLPNKSEDENHIMVFTNVVCDKRNQYTRCY